MHGATRRIAGRRTVAQDGGAAELAVGDGLGAGLRAGGGSVTGVAYSSGISGRRRRGLRRQRAAEQQKRLARSRAGSRRQGADEEDLLAKVDSDVSREVPSAMEPLAQMMDDGTK